MSKAVAIRLFFVVVWVLHALVSGGAKKASALAGLQGFYHENALRKKPQNTLIASIDMPAGVNKHKRGCC